MKTKKKTVGAIIASVLAATVTVAFLCFGPINKENVVGAPAETTSIVTTTEETTVATTVATTSMTTSVTTETTTEETTEEITEITTISETEENIVPKTEPVVIEPVASSTSTIVEKEEVAPAPVQPEPEYVVFKEATHYIHRNTCHWAKSGNVQKIENTEGIEARKCGECNPDMEIINVYEEPTPTYNCSLSDYEYNLIMQLMCNEYGSATMIERAKIVAATMNACSRNNWSVETFVYRACVPFGFTPGYSSYHGVSVADMADAMEYYFTYGTAGFYDSGYWCEGADSWWGDGYYNHFYRA